MSHTKPAHFFLEDKTDLGWGVVTKHDNGAVEITVPINGEDKTIAIGGSVGLKLFDPSYVSTYTLMGVVKNDTVWDD